MHTQTNDNSQSRPKVIFKRKATRSRNLHSFIPIESTRCHKLFLRSRAQKIIRDIRRKKEIFEAEGCTLLAKKKNILLPWLIVQNVSPIAIVKAGATLQQLWMESDGY